MEGKDMVMELWSLANIITGFSIAQSLAFAFALGRDLAKLQSQTTIVKIVLTVSCVVFGIIYSFAVFRCHRLATSVDTAHEAIWLEVTYGRVICIWLFTTVPVFGLFARNIFGK
jgi:hypothetical protein